MDLFRGYTCITTKRYIKYNKKLSITKQKGDMMDTEKIKAVEDEIREIINWIKVFETEYKLPEEVVEQLRSRLEKIAQMLA